MNAAKMPSEVCEEARPEPQGNERIGLVITVGKVWLVCGVGVRDAGLEICLMLVELRAAHPLAESAAEFARHLVRFRSRDRATGWHVVRYGFISQ